MSASTRDCYDGKVFTPVKPIFSDLVRYLQTPSLKSLYIFLSASSAIHHGIFKNKLYFGIILDLQKSCKDTTRSSYIPLTQFFSLLNILYYHSTFATETDTASLLLTNPSLLWSLTVSQSFLHPPPP